MQVSSHHARPGNLRVSRMLSNSTPQPSSEPPAPKKSTEGWNLPPNNRHHWDDKSAGRVRAFRNVLIPLMFRRNYTGLENIPKDGNYIVGPSHQGMFDAAVASEIPGKDAFGSMSAAEQFQGPIGKLLSGLGSFPVDRYGEYEGDFPDPVDHAVEILNEGKHFVFYPEGRIYADEIVYPLKTGIGRIAMQSSAKYTLPVGQHFARDTESHPLEGALGLALSAGAGLGAWAALQHAGAPVAGAVAGILGGAMVGGVLGFLTGDKDDSARRVIKAAKWAGIGALGGGAATSLAAGLAPSATYSAVAGGLTGVAGAAITYHWTHRPVAHMNIGKPIEIEPHRQRAAASSEPDAEWKEALKIVAKHHQGLSAAKQEITGVESPFKMDDDGNAWGKQPDGRWVRVERNENREWVPVEGS